MPARRRKRKRKNNSRSIPRKRLIFYILILLLLFLVLAGYLIFGASDNDWDGESKLSIVFDNNDNGVVVVLLDPIHQEIYKFYYPENLEIEAARNLGKWKIGSLWKLGKDEGVGGRLLAHSISKSMRTPVLSWSGSESLDILDSRYVALFWNIIQGSSSSNLSVMDKIRINRFSSAISDANTFEYHTEDLDFISSQELTDGTEGYVIVTDPPAKILTLFANDYVISNPNRTLIIYSGDNEWKAKTLGEVMEVVGVKIASIQNETHEINDCEVSSEDAKTAEILSNYFDCDYNTKTSTNFDVEIRIGDRFAERF